MAVSIPCKLAPIFSMNTRHHKKKGQKMQKKQSPKNYPNLYELTLLLADAQSRDSEYRWASFVDNLSRICDKFASEIPTKEKPKHAWVEVSQRYSYRI